MAFGPPLQMLRLTPLQIVCYPAVDDFVARFKVILISVSQFSHVIAYILYILN